MPERVGTPKASCALVGQRERIALIFLAVILNGDR